jgi:hypothetical protein
MVLLMSDYRHWPAFDQLCATAEKAGLQVRLSVSTECLQAFGHGRAEEYRALAAVEIWTPRFGACVERAFIFDDDLEAAAQDLLARAA